MLFRSKATNHGYGYVDPDDVPHIGKGEEVENAHDGLTQQRWNWFMDELIWTFEQLSMDDHEGKFYDHTKSRKIKDINKSVSQIKVDRVGLRKHNERIDNGLRLFGKYYRALWD